MGHALSRQAIHGGKANNDTIDAQNIAARLRGGLLPQASVDPAKRRATRDLWRRRTPLRRTRAELLAHGHNTKSQYTLPEIGQKMADNTNRDGVAAVLFLRHHPAGQTDLAHVETNHDQGKALTILAHKLARAISDRLTRQTAFAMDKFLHG